MATVLLVLKFVLLAAALVLAAAVLILLMMMCTPVFYSFVSVKNGKMYFSAQVNYGILRYRINYDGKVYTDDMRIYGIRIKRLPFIKPLARWDPEGRGYFGKIKALVGGAAKKSDIKRYAAPVLKTAGSVAKKMMPKKLRGECTFGLGDPAMTGIAAGLADSCFCVAFPQWSVAIRGDYVNASLEYELKAGGWFFPAALVWPVFTLFIKLRVR